MAGAHFVITVNNFTVSFARRNTGTGSSPRVRSSAALSADAAFVFSSRILRVCCSFTLNENTTNVLRRFRIRKRDEIAKKKRVHRELGWTFVRICWRLSRKFYSSVMGTFDL